MNRNLTAARRAARLDDIEDALEMPAAEARNDTRDAIAIEQLNHLLASDARALRAETPSPLEGEGRDGGNPVKT